MGEEDWMGMLCCFMKEEEMTLPCAPPSMRIRAGCPLTLQIKVSRVDFALSTVNACRRNPFDRRNRRALLLDTVGSGADIIKGSETEGVVTRSDVGQDAGAKDRGGTGGSRSTVSANVAPIFRGGGLEAVHEAAMLGRGDVDGGLTRGLISAIADGRGEGSFLGAEKDLLKLKAENLSEARTLLLWSRGTEEGVAATETWTSLSCCCLFPTGPGSGFDEALVQWQVLRNY